MVHEPFQPLAQSTFTNDFSKCPPNPNQVQTLLLVVGSVQCALCLQLRWKPFDLPHNPTDLVEGLATVCGAGDPKARSGVAVHVYACNQSMKNKCFYNADGDFLIGRTVQGV